MAFFILQNGKYRQVDALEYIRRSHRSSEGMIFGAPTSKKRFPVARGGCTRAELENHAEWIEKMCRGEFYVTSNCFWIGDSKIKKNGLRYAPRKLVTLRYIERVSVDLDVGRITPVDDEGTFRRQFLDDGKQRPAQRLTAEQAVAIALKRLEKEAFPTPSAIVYSGQGAQLHFDLHDAQNPSNSPKDISVNKELHKAISQRLIEIFHDLEPDKSARDLARFFRVPGSINKKSGREVWAQYQIDGDGQSPTYSLAELAQAFDAKPETKRKCGTTRKKAPLRRLPNNKRGEIERAVKRERDLAKVEAHQGGYQDGERRNCLYARAQNLVETGCSRGELTAQLLAIAAECNPPFPSPGKNNDGTIADIVAEAYGPTENRVKNSNLRNEYLMSRFGITPELARLLELETIMPEEMLKARDAKKRETKVAASPTTRRREAIIAQLVTAPGTSINGMREILAAQGYNATRSTIGGDMARFRKQTTPPKPEALGALISVQKPDTPCGTYQAAEDEPELSVKEARTPALSFSVQKPDTQKPDTPEVAEILDAARRLEMLLEVPSDDEFDLRELSKLCIEENRLPGINETKWLRKVLDKTERIEEQHHDEYTKKTYGLAA